MVKTGRARSALLTLLLCALLTAGSVFFAAAVADAGPLEEVTGPTQGAVGAPPAVNEVTETTAPPVQELTETVAPPVKEATETVTRPVNEVTETGKPPVKEATETITSSPRTVPVKPAASATAHAVTTTTGSSSGGPTKSAGIVVHEGTGTATRAADETVGAVTRATRTAPSSAGAEATGADAGTARDAVPPHESAGSASTAAAPDDGVVRFGPRDDTFEAPSVDGSIRVPLDKLMSYVWPAVALTQPTVAKFLERWEEGALRLAFETPSGRDDGALGDPVVAGVHASHDGRVEAPSPSHSLFSKIPSAIGSAFSHNAPLPMVVFILVVGLGVTSLFAAVGWDIGLFARRRRRWR
jgi:hypothetical protein